MEYEDLRRLSGHFCNLGEDKLCHFTPYIFPCKVSSQALCTRHLRVTNIRYRQFHTQKDLHFVSTMQCYSHISRCNCSWYCWIPLIVSYLWKSLCSVVKASSCSKSASCRVCAMVGGVGCKRGSGGWRQWAEHVSPSDTVISDKLKYQV